MIEWQLYGAVIMIVLVLGTTLYLAMYFQKLNVVKCEYDFKQNVCWCSPKYFGMATGWNYTEEKCMELNK